MICCCSLSYLGAILGRRDGRWLPMFNPCQRVTLMEKDLHLVNKLRIRKLTKVVRYTSAPNASSEERLAAAERAYDGSAMPEDNDIS